jgi:hypothetical protein
VVAAYSPRIRPDVPVSFPVAWDELDRVTPADFTVHTAARLIGQGDPWADRMPEPQQLSPDLIEEGHTISVARVQGCTKASGAPALAAADYLARTVGVRLSMPVMQARQ